MLFLKRGAGSILDLFRPCFADPVLNALRQRDVAKAARQVAALEKGLFAVLADFVEPLLQRKLVNRVIPLSKKFNSCCTGTVPLACGS